MSDNKLTPADYSLVREHLKNRLPSGRKPSNRRYRNAIFWSVRQVLGAEVSEAQALSAYKEAYEYAKAVKTDKGKESTWPGTFPGDG